MVGEKQKGNERERRISKTSEEGSVSVTVFFLTPSFPLISTRHQRPLRTVVSLQYVMFSKQPALKSSSVVLSLTKWPNYAEFCVYSLFWGFTGT